VLQTLTTFLAAWELVVTGWAASSFAIADLEVARLSTAGSTGAGPATTGCTTAELAVAVRAVRALGAIGALGAIKIVRTFGIRLPVVSLEAAIEWSSWKLSD
jgi:hypothetical protein